MKTIALLLLLVGCMTTPEQTNETPNRSFTLRISHTEKSKDSHSTNEFWRFDKKELAYQKTFTGRKGKKNMPEKTIKTLSNEQIQALNEIIAQESLEKNIDTPKHSEFHVPYTATSVVWELEKDNKHFRIELYATSEEMRTDETYKKLLKVVEILQK